MKMLHCYIREARIVIRMLCLILVILMSIGLFSAVLSNTTQDALAANIDDVYRLLDDTNSQVYEIHQSVVPSNRRLTLTRRNFRSPSVLQELNLLKSQVSHLESKLEMFKIFACIWTILLLVSIISTFVFFKKYRQFN